jgi:hypothetical protein
VAGSFAGGSAWCAYPEHTPKCTPPQARACDQSGIRHAVAGEGEAMEEDEWLICTYPSPMLECLPTPTARKERLFAVACCRRVWEYLPGASSKHAVEVAERYADGNATSEELEAACEAEESHPSADYGLIQVVRPAASLSVDADNCALNTSLLFADITVPDEGGKRWEEADGAESSAQANLLRDIFGNPFRPVTFAPEWRTDTAIALARQMYESREFGAMPILADALLVAGCDTEDILAHCRGDGPHVRGCWVVDLVLGKE